MNSGSIASPATSAYRASSITLSTLISFEALSGTSESFELVPGIHHIQLTGPLTGLAVEGGVEFFGWRLVVIPVDWIGIAAGVVLGGAYNWS